MFSDFLSAGFPYSYRDGGIVSRGRGGVARRVLRIVYFLSVLPCVYIFRFGFGAGDTDFVDRFISRMSPGASTLGSRLYLHLFCCGASLRFASGTGRGRECNGVEWAVIRTFFLYDLGV